MCVCVCVCVFAYVHAYVRACLYACGCVSVSVCVERMIGREREREGGGEKWKGVERMDKEKCMSFPKNQNVVP